VLEGTIYVDGDRRTLGLDDLWTTYTAR